VIEKDLPETQTKVIEEMAVYLLIFPLLCMPFDLLASSHAW
jgi:hypothetical protein